MNRASSRSAAESAFPWAGVLLVAGVVGLTVPLMLGLPLTADPVLYDLQARCVIEGGVLYRDMVEPNLPGIVWLHIGIRSILGWSETALKAVDLAIMAIVVVLLVSWTQRMPGRAAGWRSPASLGLAVLLWICYCSSSEWCHCQRDPWLLLPALIGLSLRRRQIERVSQSDVPAWRLSAWGLLEGAVWAIGFWIKPFIAIPAVAVLLIGMFRSPAAVRRQMFDLLAVLVGGMLIGAAGTGWLLATGAWPHFWDMMLHGNPAYWQLGSDRPFWDRLARQQVRFFPFSLAHLLAIPWSVYLVSRPLRRRRMTPLQWNPLLLAALYLGWLAQCLFLQQMFDYIHLPAQLLALTIAASQGRVCLRWVLCRFSGWSLHRCRAGEHKEPAGTPSVTERTSDPQISASVIAGGCAVGFWLLIIAASPLFTPQRLAQWPACVWQGSTPAVKTALQQFPLPVWSELEPALAFLSEQNLRDGELTVHNGHLVHAYAQLGLMPSTRYVYLDTHIRLFQDRAAEVAEALDHSGHQFVLSSLFENGMSLADSRAVTPGAPHTLPPGFPAAQQNMFPYNQPVVFRSGQYLVHRVERAVAPLNPQFSPLAATSLPSPPPTQSH